jgi:hypothetical protein
LPGYLWTVRAILFGSRPDAAMLDYRLRQYMTFLHATELAGFVTLPDPRITYEPGSADPADFDFTPVVETLGTDRTLYVLGGGPLARDGRMAHAWRIEVAAGTVTIERRSPGSALASAPLAYTEGLSDEYPLIGSRLAVRFLDGPAADLEWLVTCLGRPDTDPGQVAANLGAIGEDAMLRLFGTTPVEPYRTWKALWYSDQPLPYRLGAVLLATAWRTDEVRGRT